jgi:hypothetical protein
VNVAKVGKQATLLTPWLRSITAIYIFEYPDKTPMAEHSINLEHGILLQDTTVLSNKCRCMDDIWEANEIKLYLIITGRTATFKSWKPPIFSLKECKMPPS